MILVDCNGIIDVRTKDSPFQSWSEAALSEAADRDEGAINPIIYAEIAAGARTPSLPDFYIGAHAAVSGLYQLTHDTRRYAGYFPKLQLILPPASLSANPL